MVHRGFPLDPIRLTSHLIEIMNSGFYFMSTGQLGIYLPKSDIDVLRNSTLAEWDVAKIHVPKPN